MDERPLGEEIGTGQPTEAAQEEHAAREAGRDRGTELRTFLIADIRGYTSYTEEHGDQAASTLATRFAGLVREVVEGREGFLLELRGDEALAVFVSARQALRAANELQRRFEIEALPRGVGIGLDAGEAISTEGGFRGSALNLAARLCSQAGPGQIVASETVIHLAARVDGLAYIDARTLRLKGLDQPVRAVTVVPEGRAPQHRRRPRARLPIERPWLIAAGAGGLGVAALAVALLVGGVLGGPSGPSSSPRAPGPSGPTSAASPTPVPSKVPGADEIATDELPVLTFIDPTTGSPIELLRGFSDPAEAIYVDGAFWVLDRRPRAIHRIDAITHKVTLAIPIGFELAAFTVGGGRLWVSDATGVPSLHEFDVVSGRELRAFRIENERPWYQGIEGLAFGDGALWASYGWPGDVARIDPVTGKTISGVTTSAIADLQFADGFLWVMDPGRGEVVSIDAATNKVVARTAVKQGIQGLAAGGGYAWVALPGEGSVTRIDEAGRTTSFATGAGARFVSLDPSTGIVWVGNYSAGSVSAIDSVTGEVRPFVLGHAVQPVVAGGGQVLAGLTKGPEDVVAELTGSVMRAATDEDFAVNDPAMEYGFRGIPRTQLDHATCARLLDYPTAAADGGLAPSVAASMPEVSADGRTYTFQIRPGFAFSPPSNEPLTAETYRYSIERALSPGLGVDDIAPGYLFLPEIRGALRFHSGQTDRLEGIRTEGDRLTIDLVTPSPTFLQRLWLPLFCPVPIGTPAVTGGINDPPIPRAGKYYIADHFNNQVTILRRNPNHPEPNPAGFDAIAWFYEPNLGRAVGRVERGELDYAAGWGPELAPAGRIDQAWGPTSDAAAAGDQRLFRQPTLVLEFLAVNPASEALADADVRRAVALALDRRAAATYWGIPTDEIMPLQMPGLIASDRFPLDGARPDEARALVGDRSVSVKVAWWRRDQCVECGLIADDMRRQFAAVGIDATFAESEDPRLFARGTDSGYDLAVGFAWLNYPDPATWLYDLVAKAAPEGWIAVEARQEIDRILKLTGDERQSAAAVLADRLTSDLALIPFVNEVYGQFVSQRLGCLAFQSSYAYLDLTTVCLD